jgi:hypothetical protein
VDQTALHSLSAFRILFGSLFAYFYCSRALQWKMLYTESGLMPNSYLNTIEFFRYNFSLLRYTDNPDFSLYWNIALVIFALFATIGLFTRLSIVATYILAAGLFNRNPGSVSGVDMISTHFWFLLCLTNAGSHYSVDNWLRKKFGATPRLHKMDNFTSAGIRLMQLQLCIVYVFSAFEKIRGDLWWNGSALWASLSIGNLFDLDLTFMGKWPVLISLATYSVMLWEVYFPALVFNTRTRDIALAFGVMFHLGIIMLMNLPVFALCMISCYTIFLPGQYVVRALGKVKSLASA